MRARNITSIVCLSLCCSPPAIRRFIIAVVIYAVDTVLRCGFFSHILNEISKTINAHPSFTDANSPSSVSVVSIIGLFVAPSNHVMVVTV